MLNHGCHSLLDRGEGASFIATSFHSEPAVVVGVGRHGSAVVETEPSGLDYSLAECDVATDTITAADIVEGFRYLTVEVGVVATHVGVHMVYAYFGGAEYWSFPQ